ncbi:uncharacterized protein BP5553_06750 [Venustampulla echinocandica]|uniref:Heterokaryon incompatibility domain-containing protein n=1 Tax=Venustampulla echinocandica TaxID=2656787 RepID=A0A370TKT3_9HELO|nr:uncharacterized protein BP5553_06750 [Venustampulla echinocandica]RDL36138.1 hypothetical protein BP5553_06750 [Venustampulla echinocandica]
MLQLLFGGAGGATNEQPQILKDCIDSLLDVQSASEHICQFTVRKHGGGYLFPQFNIWNIRSESQVTGIDLYRVAAESCPWEFLRMKPHLPGSTASDESYSWAYQQMERCLSEHPGCGPGLGATLPTRVLDLGHHKAKVKLLETQGKSGQYATLSHSWGDPAHMTTKLTSHTLVDYRAGISMDLMPQTFQDASDKDKDSKEDEELCREDWAQESAKMCSVYANSYLSLAAASASGCRDGLLSRPKTVKLEGIDPEGSKYCLFARKEIRHYSSSYPLLDRGWVFQESLLSPKTLFFGQYELFWQCRELAECQCSSLQSKIKHYPEFLKLPLLEHATNHSKAFGPIQTTTLTFQTDKLAAINGLTEYMSRLRNGKYMAGLWEDSLAMDLLWRVDTAGTKQPTRTEQENYPVATTPWSSEKWLFPTWSWVSVNGRIEWDLDRVLKDSTAEVFLVRRPDEPLRLREAAPKNPAYKLELRGILVPTKLSEVKISLNREVNFHADYDFETCHKGVVSPEATVYCLRVCKYKNEYKSLVLIRIDEAERIYERIGILQYTGEPSGTCSLPDEMYEMYELDEEASPCPLPMVKGLPFWWELHKEWKPEETDITIK